TSTQCSRDDFRPGSRFRPLHFPGDSGCRKPAVTPERDPGTSGASRPLAGLSRLVVPAAARGLSLPPRALLHHRSRPLRRGLRRRLAPLERYLLAVVPVERARGPRSLDGGTNNISFEPHGERGPFSSGKFFCRIVRATARAMPAAPPRVEDPPR